MDAIFDDRDHFLAMKETSGLTHPRLAETTDVSKLHIRNVRDLRRIIETKLHLFFCDLCLKHRPVFTSEQLLYTRAELQEHKTRGDPSGPLKQDNFKGHPKCKCVPHCSDLHERLHLPAGETQHSTCHTYGDHSPLAGTSQTVKAPFLPLYTSPSSASVHFRQRDASLKGQCDALKVASSAFPLAERHRPA
jgi:hypothetical protein